MFSSVSHASPLTKALTPLYKEVEKHPEKADWEISKSWGTVKLRAPAADHKAALEKAPKRQAGEHHILEAFQKEPLVQRLHVEASRFLNAIKGRPTPLTFRKADECAQLLEFAEKVTKRMDDGDKPNVMPMLQFLAGKGGLSAKAIEKNEGLFLQALRKMYAPTEACAEHAWASVQAPAAPSPTVITEVSFRNPMAPREDSPSNAASLTLHAAPAGGLSAPHGESHPVTTTQVHGSLIAPVAPSQLHVQDKVIAEVADELRTAKGADRLPKGLVEKLASRVVSEARSQGETVDDMTRHAKAVIVEHLLGNAGKVLFPELPAVKLLREPLRQLVKALTQVAEAATEREGLDFASASAVAPQGPLPDGQVRVHEGKRQESAVSVHVSVASHISSVTPSPASRFAASH